MTASDIIDEPSRSESPTVAVVGCGYWGKNLVRNFHGLGALAAVCDNDPEQGRRIADEYSVPLRAYDDVLADPDIAGVVIATPAVDHARLVKAAILQGKHVFVEKPLALALSDAAELCDLAAAHERILMVGHLLRYHPAFLRLREICSEGQLGRINYIYSNRLSLGKIRIEENALWSFAPHDISMILALMNDVPETVEAVGHSYINKGIADVTTTHLTFASGQAAHIHVSWLHPFKEQRLVVVGDRGMAVFDDSRAWTDKLQTYAHMMNWRNGMPIPEKAEGEPIGLEPAEPLKLECQHFLECLATGATPWTDGQEGLRVLGVLDAAQKSLHDRQAVETSEFRTVEATSFVHPTACVDQPSVIGVGSKIWHFSHVLANSNIGEACNIGQNVVIGPDVTLGARCKIQNNVSVYPGVTLEDDVFCGPSMVFTNVVNPRAHVSRKDEFKPTLVRKGATIGANATIVCGVEIGRYAFIGAGAVVTHDVADHALMVGNPARAIGHMCECGERLPDASETDLACNACGESYRMECGALSRVSKE
ncbi:MAG: Gfo/Idh/MocA family oxidoreductase [Rhodospirillaceae bacterium]|mgnify:CR=1 FL=1|jgi:UDP-2-acetamido-3-amino-2,3-dideoxy-glucuronate N-acetyltransferase|nr:Gfo/Idh/MocA family oxidoreductase [Rhodospirillaceae bacterium]